jgi:hypothetical protein
MARCTGSTGHGVRLLRRMTERWSGWTTTSCSSNRSEVLVTSQPPSARARGKLFADAFGVEDVRGGVNRVLVGMPRTVCLLCLWSWGCIAERLGLQPGHQERGESDGPGRLIGRTASTPGPEAVPLGGAGVTREKVASPTLTDRRWWLLPLSSHMCVMHFPVVAVGGWHPRVFRFTHVWAQTPQHPCVARYP